MAPSPSRRPQPKGKIKIGVCVNHNYTDPNTDQTGDCPKCASGEKMKVEVKRVSDFRCPVCGGNLQPVKPPVKWWIWVVATVIVICLVLLLIMTNKSEEKSDQQLPAQIVEVADTVKTDTVSTEPVVTEPEKGADEVSNNTKEEPKKETKAGKSTTGGSTTAPASPKTVLGGAAVMSQSQGYTTITFKRPYSLDTGDAEHSTLTINPDDKIYMANVRNGILYGGQLQRSNGEEKSLSGLKVRL